MVRFYTPSLLLIHTLREIRDRIAQRETAFPCVVCGA